MNENEVDDGAAAASVKVPKDYATPVTGSSIETAERKNDGKTDLSSKLSDNIVANKKGIESFFPDAGRNSGEGKVKNVQRTPRNPYRDCEIDCTVLESLPEDIRREIQQSLVRNNQQVKRTKEGTSFFGSRRSSAAKDTTSDSCGNKEAPLEPNSSLDRTLTSDCIQQDHCLELVKCEKCGAKLSQWEMSEHFDYHFALDLQKGERNSTATKTSNVVATEPPKKKQKTTIQSFFTPK